MDTCHHIRFWGVTNGIRARLHRSHVYKPSRSRVLRIGTETSVLIFERLWRLLQKLPFVLSFLIVRGYELSVESFVIFRQMARTTATVGSRRWRAAHESFVGTPARGRGPA